MKFTSFVMKNCDFPFWVKQVVCEAALFSSVLYGCESWLCNGAKVIEPAYRSLIKVLLGVRSNTANDLCLIELAGVKTEMGQYWFLRTSAPWEVLVRNQSALVRIFTIP